MEFLLFSGFLQSSGKTRVKTKMLDRHNRPESRIAGDSSNSSWHPLYQNGRCQWFNCGSSHDCLMDFQHHLFAAHNGNNITERDCWTQLMLVEELHASWQIESSRFAEMLNHMQSVGRPESAAMLQQLAAFQAKLLNHETSPPPVDPQISMVNHIFVNQELTALEQETITPEPASQYIIQQAMPVTEPRLTQATTAASLRNFFLKLPTTVGTIVPTAYPTSDYGQEDGRASGTSTSSLRCRNGSAMDSALVSPSRASTPPYIGGPTTSSFNTIQLPVVMVMDDISSDSDIQEIPVTEPLPAGRHANGFRSRSASKAKKTRKSGNQGNTQQQAYAISILDNSGFGEGQQTGSPVETVHFNEQEARHFLSQYISSNESMNVIADGTSVKNIIQQISKGGNGILQSTIDGERTKASTVRMPAKIRRKFVYEEQIPTQMHEASVTRLPDSAEHSTSGQQQYRPIKPKQSRVNGFGPQEKKQRLVK